jgi:hypothetical protein
MWSFLKENVREFQLKADAAVASLKKGVILAK